MEERNGNRRTSHNPPSGVYHGTFSKASSKVSGKASGLKWKIAVCILIIIAVLIVKKFDGQAKTESSALLRNTTDGIILWKMWYPPYPAV